METKGLCCKLLGLSGGEGFAVGHGGGGENKMTGNEIDQSKYILHAKFGQSEFSCVTAIQRTNAAIRYVCVHVCIYICIHVSENWTWAS
jgi:hypothetical protein